METIIFETLNFYSIVADSKITDLLGESTMFSLDGLSKYLNSYISTYVRDSKSLAAIFMLIYFSIKSYGIMTGDEKLEIMPLLRPFGLLLVITFWSQFTVFIASPINAMENKAKAHFTGQLADINALKEKRDLLVTRITDNYFKEEQQIKKAELGILESISKTASDLISPAYYKEVLAKKAMILWAKIRLSIDNIIQSIGVIIFRTGFYLLIYLKTMIVGMLVIIGPFSFGLSIIPAFKDSYIKWISKFISASLYGFFGYLSGLMALAAVTIGLEQEVLFWKKYDVPGPPKELLNDLIIQTSGQFYFVVSMLIAVVGFMVVPIVSHWVVGQGSTGSLANKSVEGTKTVGRALSSMAGALKKIKNMA